MFVLQIKLWCSYVKQWTFSFKRWTFYFKRWTFHYKIVELLFVRTVLPNLPNPPGYRPARPFQPRGCSIYWFAHGFYFSVSCSFAHTKLGHAYTTFAMVKDLLEGQNYALFVLKIQRYYISLLIWWICQLGRAV